MRKLRNLFLNLFAWRIEVRVKRLDADQRILWLANRLMDECEAAGYETDSSPGLCLKGIDISHYIPPKFKDDIHVHNITAGWNVVGKRTT